jgi:DNA helicase-2/ATP-dependent DNA helicase PcrA
VVSFFKVWERWKTKNELIDFTDMIAFSLLGEGGCPGGQAVGFFDEVQDFTPLELAVVRRWSESMDRVLLAGDDDQCLYSFKGATPKAFLEPEVPAEHKRVLSKSWRVPKVVHTAAERWIRRVAYREPKLYQPRDEAGELRELDVNIKTGDKALKDAEQYLRQGKTVMFLTSCSYMLKELQARLREQFLPFHNPYRKSRADWNPLAQRKGAVTMRDRIASFLRECEDIVDDSGKKLWTAEDLHRWTGILKASGNLKKGAKAQIEDWADANKPVLSRDIRVQTEMFFEDEAWRRAVARDLQWYGESLVGSKEKAAKYPIGVAATHGIKALEEKPKILVGTIHSVKGGEADVVYLFPDLSLAGAQEWARRGDGRDAIVRQFYVGMTRCRESLIVCKPATRTLYVPLTEALR